MNIIRRLDIWLGKTLFHPPIILLCQRTRQTQYAIYRTFWFFAACHATYYAMAEGAEWLSCFFLWAFTLLLMISAAVYPDRPTISLGITRFVFWVFFIMGIFACAIAGAVTDGTVRAIIILFAEYAATIKTIPPRKKREKRAVGKGAFSGQ